MTTHRLCLVAALFTLASTSAAAQPAAATLISPSSDVNGTTIAFTWQSASTATWYHFWLGKADTSLVMDQWYTAEHAGCSTGGTCTITVTPPVKAGGFIWHIRTWSSAGYGPWSPAHMFTVRDVVQAWSGRLPPSRRFTLVLGDAAVLDNETGLVWQRNAATLGGRRWSLAQPACVQAVIGARFGWRMPTVAELMSLLDPTAGPPRLPPGHPFLLPAAVGDSPYWTQTQYSGGTTYWFVDVASGNSDIAADDPTVTYRVWCVRGGTSASQ
jgi:hypothetical protein